jgi:hypothetical protein
LRLSEEETEKAMTKPESIEFDFNDTYHPGAFEIKMTVPVGQYADTEVVITVNIDEQTITSRWRTEEL